MDSGTGPTVGRRGTGGAGQGCDGRRGEGPDEVGVGSEGRRPEPLRASGLPREFGVFVIELHEGLDMLRDKGDGRNQNAQAFRARISSPLVAA